MLNGTAFPELEQVLLGFAVNLTAIVVLAVLIFFRRHAKPGLTVVFAFFNIGLFAVVTVISHTELSAPVGFGLFAMLSIIRLRSDPFSPREIAYFFGALVLGLVNGITGPNVVTLVLNLSVVAAMYVLDHPRLFVVAPSLDVTFDRVIADPDELHRALEQRLAVRVGEISISSVDYVRDLMELKVQYVPAERAGRRPRGSRSPRHDLNMPPPAKLSPPVPARPAAAVGPPWPPAVAPPPPRPPAAVEPPAPRPPAVAPPPPPRPPAAVGDEDDDDLEGDGRPPARQRIAGALSAWFVP